MEEQFGQISIGKQGWHAGFPAAGLARCPGDFYRTAKILRRRRQRHGLCYLWSRLAGSNQRLCGLCRLHSCAILHVMSADSPNSALSADAQAIVFSARLTPHRSLGRQGHIILFTCVIGVSFIISIPFYLLGALPVVGFFEKCLTVSRIPISKTGKSKRSQCRFMKQNSLEK